MAIRSLVSSAAGRQRKRERNTKYTSLDGNVYSKDETTLLIYAIGKQDKSFIIPSKLTTIGEWAFANSSNLEEVVFTENSNLKSILNGAFSNCANLKTVFIPASVTNISNYAFGHCRNLDTVTISDGVTGIDISAFADSVVKTAVMPIDTISCIPKQSLQNVVLTSGT